MAYTLWSGGQATGVGAAFTSGTLTIAAGDFIALCYAAGDNSNEDTWSITLSGGATAISWTKRAESNTAGTCKCVLWTGIAGATPPTTITVTATAPSGALDHSKWMAVIAHTGAHATTPIPAGNIFLTNGVDLTDCSQAITPTSVGSWLWMFVADWVPTNSFVAIANCTLGTVYNEAGQQTDCTIRPTTQPRTDTSSFTLGETDTGGTVTWIAFEIQAETAFTLDQSAFRFRADDGSETTATWLTTQNTIPTTDYSTPPEPAMKWTPGHYMQVTDWWARTPANRFTYYDASEFASSANFAGASMMFTWSMLESNTTRGDYTDGIALVTAEIAKLQSLAVPKKLIISIWDQYPGDGAVNWPDSDDYFPHYLKDAGVLVSMSDRITWKKWDATTMGWFIDMINAYGAVFDGNAAVEMIRPCQESSLPSSTPGGFSYSGYVTQMERLVDALKVAWPSTNVWFPMNWGPGPLQSDVSDFCAYCAASAVAIGGPDVAPGWGIWADDVIDGTYGSHDYRGEVPIVYSVETSELGEDTVGVAGGYTIQEVYDFIDGDMHCTHMLWDHNTYVGDSTNQQWYGADGIVNITAANPLNHTTYPTAYP